MISDSTPIAITTANQNPNPNPIPDTTDETCAKLDIMHDEFRKRIKSLPLVIQYSFIELFSKYYNEHFTHNPIITRSIFQFNTMDLTGSNDEFKKRIITSGLKMLSDELCPIFVASKAKHAHPKIHCDALNAYLRIIRELIETLDIQTIKDILLDDFAQYEHDYINTVISKQNIEQTTIGYLNLIVFDNMDNLRLELVKVIDEQRFDRFEECLGIIVLMAENNNKNTCYYLIYDILTKKIFKYDHDSYYGCTDRMKTDDFAIELEERDENGDEDEVDDDVDKPSTSTSTNTVTQLQTQSSNNLFTNAFVMCILFTTIIPMLIVGLMLGFWLYNGIHDFFEIYRAVTDAISEPKFSPLG